MFGAPMRHRERRRRAGNGPPPGTTSDNITAERRRTRPGPTASTVWTRALAVTGSPRAELAPAERERALLENTHAAKFLVAFCDHGVRRFRAGVGEPVSEDTAQGGGGRIPVT